MSAENAFLKSIGDYLVASALAPAPASVGIAEPDSDVTMPAIVLSLEETSRRGNGVGERSALITDGILPWKASIDLTAPFLPGDTSFSLLDTGRTLLTLPHGGQVKADGTTGTLTGADLTVKVGATSYTVVNTTPTGNQVKPDPTVGQLLFGSKLPDSGTVDVTYFLGQWEQRMERISGVLRADVCAATVDDARALGPALVDALTAPGARTAIVRLLEFSIASLSSIGARETTTNARRRTARFAFVFEHQIDLPESSGGIIRSIPITATPGVAA